MSWTWPLAVHSSVYRSSSRRVQGGGLEHGAALALGARRELLLLGHWPSSAEAGPAELTLFWVCLFVCRLKTLKKIASPVVVLCHFVLIVLRSDGNGGVLPRI